MPVLRVRRGQLVNGRFVANPKATKDWRVAWSGSMSGFSGKRVIKAGLTEAQARRRAESLIRKPENWQGTYYAERY